MGGEGSMAHANQSLKLNRSQLRGRSFRDMKDLMKSYSGKTTLEFEKIDPEELIKVKELIRAKAKKEQQKQLAVYIITVIITLILILIVFQYA